MITACVALLIGCQAAHEPNPLAYIRQDTNDFRQPEFVENKILVIQTCLSDKRIQARNMDVRTPGESLPQTVCQRRQSLGQPCPNGWQSSEPVDADKPYSSPQSIRVWMASGDSQDISKRWIATENVKRSPHVNSAGGSHDYLIDTTTLGQPVFESSISSGARELFAWSVSREVTRNGKFRIAHFWFKPPVGLRMNEFSSWRPADVEEPEKSAGWSYAVAMANSAGFPNNAVGPGSPYVRFGVFTYRHYNDADRLYWHLFKHAYSQVKELTQSADDEFQMLRDDATPIPAC